MNYAKAGKIVHYFDKIQVAVLAATDMEVKVGDKIRIGEEGAAEQVVESMQVDHAPVSEVKVGSEAGLKVAAPVKEGDIVYKVTE